MPISTSTITEDLERGLKLKKDLGQDSLDGSKSWEDHEYLVPCLPVEVIERIIKYAFLPRTKLTPTSDPFHLADSTHLLLVSHSFRQLCIPFLYHTIVVAHGCDLVTFFDSQDGLFAGEQGALRWSFVREVAIINGVEPLPLHPPTRHVSDVDWLHPLSIPQGRGIDVLCFLEGDEDVPPVEEEEEVEELVGFMRAEEGWRADSREIVLESHPQIYALPEDADDNRIREMELKIEEDIDDNIERNIVEEIGHERNEFWREILANFRPAELRLSSQTARHHQDDYNHRNSVQNETILSITCSESDSGLVIPDLSGWIFALSSPSVTFASVHLERFPSSFLVRWAKAVKEERSRDHSGISYFWRYGYAWSLPCGSLFSLPAPPLQDEPSSPHEQE